MCIPRVFGNSRKSGVGLTVPTLANVGERRLNLVFDPFAVIRGTANRDRIFLAGGLFLAHQGIRISNTKLSKPKTGIAPQDSPIMLECSLEVETSAEALCIALLCSS